MEFHPNELSAATNSYNGEKIIGEGGFGKVYKGQLRYTTVAIKILTDVSTIVQL